MLLVSIFVFSQGAEYNLIECFFPGGNSLTEVIHQSAVDAMNFFVRIAYNKNIVTSLLWAGLLGNGKNCCVENESTNAVFFRRRRTAQSIRRPACVLHAHGVLTYRLAGPSCGRPHDPTAGFSLGI